MKKSLRCICAAIFMLAFCTGFVIHASAVERASLYLTRYSAERLGALPENMKVKAG